MITAYLKSSVTVPLKLALAYVLSSVRDHLIFISLKHWSSSAFRDQRHAERCDFFADAFVELSFADFLIEQCV